jgi:hypothetical protein
VTQPGYPDYARVPLAAGYLIGSGNATYSGNTLIVQKYVGIWQYVNFFWAGGGGNRHYTITFQYYSDATYSTQIALKSCVRDDLSLGYTQVPVLSPYLVCFIEADTGSPTTAATWAMYGTSGYATAADLAGVSTQYCEQLLSVGANSTNFFETSIVVPGPVSWSFNSGPASGTFQLQRYDIGSASWLTFWRMNILTANGTDHETVNMPDATVRVGLSNNTAAAGFMGAWGMP